MADDVLFPTTVMRAFEAEAIESGAMSGRTLMERAGRAAVAAIVADREAAGIAAKRAVVLCGPGNNGGDGFVVARLLREGGWTVAAALLGDPEALPPDAKANHRQLTQATDPAVRIADLRAADPEVGPDTVLIDALFGIGLSRPLEPAIFERLAALCARAARVIALDVPSGLDADSGRPLAGRAIRADVTLAFHALKPGHVLAKGPAFCGQVRTIPIGLPEETPTGAVRLVGPPATGKSDGHKYDHGHALVLTGGFGRTGAARLAARGALRVGAGLVTLGASDDAMMECAAQVTAVMLRRCHNGEGLRELLQDRRVNALCLGPGLGTDVRADALIRTAVASGLPTVLDADALTMLARAKGIDLHERCVLTPHAGEFARLFPDLADLLDGDGSGGPGPSKLDVAREAARRTGAIVAFKGPDTVVAAPDGHTVVNDGVGARAAPWLATAGTGDVLAGLIAGLAAQGQPPFEAASAAAWLHVEAARAFGPGLIAEDLPEALPALLSRLGSEVGGT